MKLTYNNIFLTLMLIITFERDGFSQSVHFNYDYDSIVNQLPLLKTDAEKIESLILLIDGNPEVITEPQSNQISFLKQLIELNNKNMTINIEPYAELDEAFSIWLAGDYENALVKIKRSIDLFDQQKKIIAPLLMQMRTLFNLMNNQDERFNFYKEKLNYYLINGPAENTASCYHGIAGYYNYKADYNLAISNYLRAGAIYKPFWQTMYNNEIAVVGQMYETWGNEEKAVYYLNLALPLIRKSVDTVNIAFTLMPLINISINHKKFELAHKYADESIEVTSRYKNENSPIYALAVLSKALVFLAMKEADLAYPYLMEVQGLVERFDFQFINNDGDLESDFGFYRYYMLKNDRKSAISYLQTAYNKSVKEEANIFQLKYLKDLASYYEKQNPALSIRYINSYFKLQETLEEDNQKVKVAQYEIEQKELEQNQSIIVLKQEKAIQEATINQRNTIIWISLIALILIIVSMIFLYRQFRLNKKTLLSLRKTQRQLIHAEKMASLGELTAGIAHEIQNPLNFVNNFSEVSVDLVTEMNEEIETGNTEDVKAISNDLKQNLEKISHHGKRASNIVKGMLEHSRASDGKRELTDINTLADEYLRLAYHSLKAKDKSFNADFKTDFDKTLPKTSIVPQDIGRVLLNLINNAFHACTERSRTGTERSRTGTERSRTSTERSRTSTERSRSAVDKNDFKPLVSISTSKENDQVVIKVKDNGNGIPAKVLDKIFQPFFTTKPTGQGTGLGLSLSYDIIKAHGGELKVDTKEGEGSEFRIQLPIF
ncbi:MAG: ATP-binding protein [Bacteroidales bacterium]|jgi:two-component system NtrC family sensor kinase|nr:ATP-binding protein [Bacteroidales bacterium]